MPAKSERQRKAAGAALSAKRGEQPKTPAFAGVRQPSKQMAESMTEEQLEELASTKDGKRKK